MCGECPSVYGGSEFCDVACGFSPWVAAAAVCVYVWIPAAVCAEEGDDD